MAKGGPGVVIVATGGLPVTQVAGGGNAAPFTVVTGNGFPVTLVDSLGTAVALYNLDGSEYASFSLTAPELAFASATDPDSDNTQNYVLTLTNPVAGDNVYTCAKIDGFSIANDPDEFDVRDIHEITQLEIDTLTFPISLTLTPNGSWSNRAFHERNGTFSDASNVITKVINATPSYAGTYYYLGF